MSDVAVLLVAVLLLVVGVVGSVLPAVPGALSSLAGVVLYWWHTGYVDPGPLVLAGFVALGLFALAADWFGGALSARAGGASVRTTALAAVVGLLLFPVAGPLGILVGLAGTVFLAEYRRHGDARRGGRAALYATAGALASTAAQVALTATMLAGFLVVVLT